MLYVNQLSDGEQLYIVEKIRKVLEAEGRSPDEIDEAIQEVLCSKVSDVSHVVYDHSL